MRPLRAATARPASRVEIVPLERIVPGATGTGPRASPIRRTVLKAGAAMTGAVPIPVAVPATVPAMAARGLPEIAPAVTATAVPTCGVPKVRWKSNTTS